MYKIISAAVATAAIVSVAPAAHAAPAPAPAKTQITFTFSTTHTARLSLKGTLTASGVTVPAGKQLVVETAAPNGKYWQKLPLLKGAKMPVTRAGGAFSATYDTIGFSHGYYRIRFAGDAALAPTVSKAVRDKRINAHVFGWKVTPRKIRKGSYVTFSGTLKHNPGVAYVPFKGQPVYIEGRAKGSKKWRWYARPKTNSKGYFKVRIKVTKDFYFAYGYYGDETHYWDFPEKLAFVDVR